MKLEVVFNNGLRKTIDNVKAYNVVKETDGKSGEIAIAQKPTEGKKFLVRPSEIDRNLFKDPRVDPNQERVRRLIEKAFNKVDKEPKKYGGDFSTFIPKKEWADGKNAAELKEEAKNQGGHMADWIEQALEWAQRIGNSESWETICNVPDTNKHYRMIIGESGYCKMIGGSTKFEDNYPPANEGADCNIVGSMFAATVPLIVLK